MRLLLDTHILIGLIEGSGAGLDSDLVERFLPDPPFVSVASLWEIAIKVRQGRLPMSVPLPDLEPEIMRFGCILVPISSAHATADVTPWPPTNDPFDRLLLAVCGVEGLRLVTQDTKLVDHPLAWKASA